MSERYFKSPRVNVRDRAREFEAKQASETAGKAASSIANTRPSTSPAKLPKDATTTVTNSTAVGETVAAVTLSTIVVKDTDINKDKNILLPSSDNLASNSSAGEKSNEKDKVCSNARSEKKDSSSRNEKKDAKVKVAKKEKTVTVKKKPIKHKEQDISLNNDSKTDKVGDDTAIIIQSLSKSNENGTTTAVSELSCDGDDGKRGTKESTEGLKTSDLDDEKTDAGGETPTDVIPAKNTEELVKQFNKLSSSQLVVLQKKSCSLDSGLSEITNWVNEEENDTGDDARVSDGKKFVCGAKFRKFRNGGLVKNNHQQRSTATPTADNHNKKSNFNNITNENLEVQDSDHDACLEAINKTDSSKSGSEVMCKSPNLNQRSTSYLRYLQKITQLQQQQRNSEAANIQQMVNDNYNVYANNESFSSHEHLKGFIENADKDNLEGEDAKTEEESLSNSVKTKLTQVETNFKLEEENRINTKKKVGSVSPPGSTSQSDGANSICDVKAYGSWNKKGDSTKNNSYYLEQPVNESNQIAELLTSVRKIREEFERCSLEVDQEVEEAEEVQHLKKEEKNYACDHGDLLHKEFNTNKQSTAFENSFNSISQIDDAGRCKLECSGVGDRLKKSCIPKISSSSLSTTAGKIKYENKDVVDLPILVNSFGYQPKEVNNQFNTIYNDEVDKNKTFASLNTNLSRLRRPTPEIEKQNWTNLFGENSYKLDDDKIMEERNSPGDSTTVAARPLRSKLSEQVHNPVSPIGLQRSFDISNSTNSNGANSCPNSPRSILANKSASTHPSVHFNFLNLHNSNSYQQQQNFLTAKVASPSSKLLMCSKPELPSYLTQRRRPALRKISSDSHRSESVSDSEKRELEKLESILGELDFSKYKRGPVYSNRQPNQTVQQQLAAQQYINHSSLVPIRAPRSLNQISNLSSKNHQEKLQELRELTEKLKPASSKLKFELSTSPSATISPYPTYGNLNNADSLNVFKNQNRRSHLPVLRSASVPEVDDYNIDNHTCSNTTNNSGCKSHLSSEYISDPVSAAEVKSQSPFDQFYYKKSPEQSRLNTVSAFATLPRVSKMDKFGHGNQQRLSDVDESARPFPIDANADEGLVADSEAASDYMQAYRNVTSSFSAPATPVMRHRVPNTNNSIDRFDLQVEAAIAELQATTSATNNFVNAATPTNLDILHFNSLDRRKRRKGAGLAVGFNISGGANEMTAKSGNGRSLTYPPQRRTSITDGMEYTSMDSNGIPSYIAINPVLNSSGGVTSGSTKSFDAGASNRSRYNLQVADDVANFPSELSLADSHLCPSEMSYGTTYNDVLESVTTEPSDIGSGTESSSAGGNGKALKKKHYSDPSGEKNNEGILLDLPEFISCAISEPQLPSNKSDTIEEILEEGLSRSRQSCTSLIPQHYVTSGLNRSTSLSPGVEISSDSPGTFSTNSLGRNGGSSEVTLERSDSKSPQQQRRYSKKRLRGPYGEMLEEEMRKSGEKHSQKVIAEELNFLQELMETKPNVVDVVPQVTSSSSHIEPIHSRHHLSSQSLDENALRSNQTIIDIYNKRSISENVAGDSGKSVNEPNSSDLCYTSSVPTLLDNRLKNEGPWNLCENLETDGDDFESLLKRHQVGQKFNYFDYLVL